jgi:endonuclease/exonuclease/phosphatase family metal-dependent hydrolase
MRKSRLLITLVVLALLSVLFFHHFQIEGIEQLQLRRRGSTMMQAEASLPETTPDSIRIATFNLQVFGRTKSNNDQAMQALARIGRQFHVIALQEICGPGQDAVARLVEKMNEDGGQYDFLLSKPLGHASFKQQYGFIFDRRTIDVDRPRCCSIEDPDSLFEHPPFVGYFQVQPKLASNPIRFTLVNVQINPENRHAELELMDEIYELIWNRGRGEDDVIMLGDFQTNSETLSSILGPSRLVPVLDAGVLTDTRLSKQTDNILVHSEATPEFHGKAETFRFMRRFNLSLQESLAISDHLPVWAEFQLDEE